MVGINVAEHLHSSSHSCYVKPGQRFMPGAMVERWLSCSGIRTCCSSSSQTQDEDFHRNFSLALSAVNIRIVGEDIRDRSRGVSVHVRGRHLVR